jgi:integrase/recombinase XerD
MVAFDAAFADPRRLALAGFLASYIGQTRDANALDLRQFVAWCDLRGSTCSRFAGPISKPSAATWRPRAERGRRWPAGCARWPASNSTPKKKHYSPIPPGFTCDVLASATSLTPSPWTATRSGPCWWQPGLGSPAEHALISPLALNGLRVSEAIGADIDQLGLARGHRTLTVRRKGAKIDVIPLAPRTARAVDLALGERFAGPIFIDGDGQRLDRHAAARIVRRVARRAGIAKPVGRHTLRHAFVTAALDARRATARRAGGRFARRSPHHHPL